MDKKIAGLLGAAAALATMNGAQAAPTQPPQPTSAGSYRDLLEPIPNAVQLLKADDAVLAERSTQGDVKLAYHHHHHHHHGYRRPAPRFYVRHRYITTIITTTITMAVRASLSAFVDFPRPYPRVGKALRTAPYSSRAFAFAARSK